MGWYTSSVAIVSALAAVVLLWIHRHQSRLPYPPGPPSEPILGHLRIMPSNDTEKVFKEWSKKYGDLLFLRIPGRSYLIINSLKHATELLDNRSGINSDRMRMVVFELMGWYPSLGFMRYGKRFQKHRRLFQKYLGQKQCASYHPLIAQQARRLLAYILDDPKNCVNHMQWFSTSVICQIAYGVDVSYDDPFIDIAKKGLDSLTSCGPAGNTPVDFLPILRFFPSWFPGTHYAFKARSARPAVRRMHEYLFNRVKQQLREGTANASYLSHNFEELQEDYTDIEHMEDLEGSACVMLAGGSDTTHSVLWYFLFAMVLYPEFQTRAQNEIDQLLDKSRLPEFTDQISLPYVTAIMHEVHRWNTVAPLGIPHRSIEDDTYNGMFIPKGTILVANSYAILRDATVYSDPDTFNPSRYLPKPEGNAEPYPIGQFGFGRRVCSGQHLAEASLWTAISSILSTFNIGRALDEDGKEIIPKVDIVAGLASHPKPFPFTIKPRDDASQSILRQTQLWEGI